MLRLPELGDLGQFFRSLSATTLVGMGALAAILAYWFTHRPKALQPPCNLLMQSEEVEVSGVQVAGLWEVVGRDGYLEGRSQTCGLFDLKQPREFVSPAVGQWVPMALGRGFYRVPLLLPGTEPQAEPGCGLALGLPGGQPWLIGAPVGRPKQVLQGLPGKFPPCAQPWCGAGTRSWAHPGALPPRAHRLSGGAANRKRCSSPG